MPVINIQIAEDHALLADGLQLLLGTQPDMHCVGAVRDGAAAIQMALSLAPDLLLLDLGLPGVDGLGVMQALRQAGSAVRVLVVSARLDEASVRAALALGAAGYVPKDEDSEELLQAIRAVAQGRFHISSEIARAALTPPSLEAPAPSQPLTRSEQAVLQLVGEGLTSKEIGMRLDISESTARKHRENIRRKLALRNSAEMAAYAIRSQGSPRT